jgi:hypothetical protein
MSARMPCRVALAFVVPLVAAVEAASAAAADPHRQD